MRLEFHKSFLDDLQRVQDRAILQRVKSLIETLEQADTLATVCLVRFLGRKDIYKYFP